MPVTLAEAQTNVTDDIDFTVIDEFRRSSELLNRLTFDDVVSAAGGGATLTYSYTRLESPSGAAFRALNTEYVASEATKSRQSVDLQALGGTFQIDRILDKVAAGRETAFQMSEKIKAATNFFLDRLINGDAPNLVGDVPSAAQPNKLRAASPLQAGGFDGLSKALTGSITEVNATGSVGQADVDLFGVSSREDVFAVMKQLDRLLSELSGTPDVLVMNRQAKALFVAAARYANVLGTQTNDFGSAIDTYSNIAFLDLQDVVGTNGASLPVVRTVDGKTDIYALKLGLDALHCVSLAGQPLVRSWLPNWDLPGAVKNGEVEMVTAPVLKQTRAVGVLRNVVIGGTSGGGQQGLTVPSGTSTSTQPGS